MISSDRIAELEKKKKEAIEAIDAEIAQAKSFGEQATKLAALSSEYKYANLPEFLKAHGYVAATKTKAPRAKSESTLKKGPASADEKALIKKLHKDGKSFEEIGKQVNRSAKFVEKTAKG